MKTGRILARKKKTTPRVEAKELSKEIIIKQLKILSYVSEDIMNCRSYISSATQIDNLSNISFAMTEIIRAVWQLH